MSRLKRWDDQESWRDFFRHVLEVPLQHRHQGRPLGPRRAGPGAGNRGGRGQGIARGTLQGRGSQFVQGVAQGDRATAPLPVTYAGRACPTLRWYPAVMTPS